MNIYTLVFAMCCVGTTSIAYPQEGISSPRDEASGLAVGVRLRATNSHATPVENLLVSSFTAVRASRSGTETGRRTHEPISGTMSLSPRSGPRDFPFGPSIPSVQDVSWSGSDSDNVVASEVFTLSLNGATCRVKVPARYDVSAKRIVIQLGDIAQFFDEHGKSVAKRCGER